MNTQTTSQAKRLRSSGIKMLENIGDGARHGVSDINRLLSYFDDNQTESSPTTISKALFSSARSPDWVRVNLIRYRKDAYKKRRKGNVDSNSPHLEDIMEEIEDSNNSQTVLLTLSKTAFRHLMKVMRDADKISPDSALYTEVARYLINNFEQL